MIHAPRRFAVWQLLEKLKGQDLIDWRVAEVGNRPSIEERNLDIGFPFGWYPLMMSAELAVGEVKPLRYFSQDLAIWRGEDGQVRMIDAYCKHLGAHMGYGGKVHGTLLECPFHAWRYDGEEGVVKEISYSRSIPPQVKRKCTRTWHIREANRWIWTWYHPQGHRPPVRGGGASRMFRPGVDGLRYARMERLRQPAEHGRERRRHRSLQVYPRHGRRSVG